MYKKCLKETLIKRRFLIISLFIFIFVFAASLRAQAQTDENKVAEINNSLKNVIEENQSLSTKNKDLAAQIEKLKQEQADYQDQYNQLSQDRDDKSDTLKRYKDSNQKYSKEIQKLEKQVEELEVAKKQNDRKAEELQSELLLYREDAAKKSSDDQLASASQESAKQTVQDVKAREEKTLDLLSKIDAFTEQDEALRKDSAKAHYNMGNIYFQKGEFEIAAREYYQAVTLMPDDPDAHYNLAFVSGENLKDYRTALKHYQMYLYLKPNADDAAFVREKILAAQMVLKSAVDSPLETIDK
ncbi:MAG: tetratricopeptide repeat protein [Candidatus Omnitrophica bacterium]|nr:tetratricopeptide repeat protein [Candidatus Omnitrophota bacterium]